MASAEDWPYRSRCPRPGTPVRRAARRALETTLSLTGLAAASRWWRRRDCLILAYHNIVPDGERPVGDRALHLRQREFGRQLDELCRTHDVVPLGEALRGHVPGKARRPRVALTFDDAYAGAIEAGLAETAGRGLPTTVFVAPAFVSGATFWWDALVPNDALRLQALTTCRGDDATVRQWAKARGVADQPLPGHTAAASEDALTRAAQIPGVTFGSHSWSHPNLAALAGPALADELVRPLAWLNERFANVLPVLAYPYGISSPAVESAAAVAGYQAALRVDGGWFRADHANRMSVPRLNIPAGVTTGGFRLRIDGVLRS